ncbi:hypothetical protein CYMTET_24893 [Cymbomonas tetramitiformis]|uniref:Uncharacterized protein n=1 Tax=Cymbomonas tetramitiformis TaxID=36881 RepID=A0AAE0FV64_9CHLO|nr:hypothetical protein CYMTET_24893 [Cymbomonas tetramitiformis]
MAERAAACIASASMSAQRQKHLKGNEECMRQLRAARAAASAGTTLSMQLVPSATTPAGLASVAAAGTHAMQLAPSATPASTGAASAAPSGTTLSMQLVPSATTPADLASVAAAGTHAMQLAPSATPASTGAASAAPSGTTLSMQLVPSAPTSAGPASAAAAAPTLQLKFHDEFKRPAVPLTPKQASKEADKQKIKCHCKEAKGKAGFVNHISGCRRGRFLDVMQHKA